MSHNHIANGAQDLRARLAFLLPQLAEANKVIVREQGKHSLESVDEDEQHIEMNLGLGVLEEKYEDESSGTSESSSNRDDEEGDEEGVPTSSGTVKRLPEDRDIKVMSKLLRQRPTRKEVDIEDIG